MARVLTEAERGILLAVLRDHPRVSDAQAANIFRSRAGRAIHRDTARSARLRGYKPAGDPIPGRHLSSAQRQVLDGLCLEAAPLYCRTEIARQFEAATGPPITGSAVARHLTAKLGLPKLPRGIYAGGIAQYEASRRRRERAG